MSNVISWGRKHLTVIVYSLLGLGVLLSYQSMVILLTPQTAWVNITSGKVSASILVALFVWVILIEKISKKRHWSEKKAWIMSLSGVLALIYVASTPPI
jgi:Ca2+/Na+ antiporter